MSNKVKEAWDKTAGYKTKSGAILYLVFQLFKSIFPNALNESSEEVVKYSIDLIILTGGADWVWRNKDEIIQWLTNIFSKKNKDAIVKWFTDIFNQKKEGE
jgi:hypothetical protein